MRQVILDTETTGLSFEQGHRIIEIGAIELINRRPTRQHFHYYLHPDREIDVGAQKIHGITLAFLKDKPRFVEIVEAFIDFIRDSELIIHNATFDVGFLDYELKLLGKKWGKVTDYARVTDTLTMARQQHPGQKNSLDALRKRYQVNNRDRTLHGALLDAQILADVYLAMTGGQTDLSLHSEKVITTASEDVTPVAPIALPMIAATAEEEAAHQAILQLLEKKSQKSVWLHETTE